MRSLIKDAGALLPPGEICPWVVLISIAVGEITQRLSDAGKTVLAIDHACHLFNDDTRSDGRAGASRIEQVLAIWACPPLRTTGSDSIRLPPTRAAVFQGSWRRLAGSSRPPAARK